MSARRWDLPKAELGFSVNHTSDGSVDDVLALLSQVAVSRQLIKFPLPKDHVPTHRFKLVPLPRVFLFSRASFDGFSASTPASSSIGFALPSTHNRSRRGRRAKGTSCLS